MDSRSICSSCHISAAHGGEVCLEFHRKRYIFILSGPFTAAQVLWDLSSISGVACPVTMKNMCYYLCFQQNSMEMQVEAVAVDEEA